MKMPRRRRREINMATTSMADIAFLLIIFFILTSNFAKENGIKFTPPKAPEIQTLKESRVSVLVDEKGDIYLQGKKVADAKAIEWGVAALLASAQTPEAKQVMFKCDNHADRSVFEPVIESISKAGGILVAIGDKAKATDATPR